MDEPKALEDLLNSLPEELEGEYKPGLHVPKHGDCAFVYLENAPYRAVYVDPFLTVFEAFDDERLVGFQLKGLSALQEEQLRGVHVSQNPPIIKLLMESYKLDADGVESVLRFKMYSRVTVAVEKLELQES